jgi:hypothetical protein
LRLTKADRICVLDLTIDAARDAAWDAVSTQRNAEADQGRSVLIGLDDVPVRLRAEVQ